MNRELPCRGPALTAARDVMQKLRADARRVQVDAIDLQWKNWDGELSLLDLYTDQRFLVWLDSSFLRLGPLNFPCRRAQDHSRLAARSAATRRAWP